MLFPVLCLSFLWSVATAASIRLTEEPSPRERVEASLNLVLTTINDFYVPVYSFPDHGSYDVDAWFKQTKNFSAAINAATGTLDEYSPLEKELAEYVVDFVGSYVYHDLAAALEEVRTRKSSFNEVGIEPGIVHATMRGWFSQTKAFEDIVATATQANINDDFIEASKELRGAFKDVFAEYRKPLSPQHSSHQDILKNILLGWRWPRFL